MALNKSEMPIYLSMYVCILINEFQTQFRHTMFNGALKGNASTSQPVVVVVEYCMLLLAAKK